MKQSKLLTCCHIGAFVSRSGCCLVPNLPFKMDNIFICGASYSRYFLLSGQFDLPEAV